MKPLVGDVPGEGTGSRACSRGVLGWGAFESYLSQLAFFPMSLALEESENFPSLVLSVCCHDKSGWS